MKPEVPQELIHISRSYGGDPSYVLAGGGNTSCKSGGFMWVKASGFALNGIAPEGFVRMKMASLNAIWEKTYPEDPDEREKVASADLLSARDEGEESKRPSVESLLHALFPERLVVHTHPALVNGLTCGIRGEETAHELFGGNSLWVPTVNPGYILAQTVRRLYLKHGGSPNIVFLQNHGVFVAAETVTDIDSAYRRIGRSLEKRLERRPDMAPVEIDDGVTRRWCKKIASALGGESEIAVVHRAFREILEMAESRASLLITHGSFSPDHIVYCGPVPVYVEDLGLLEREISQYRETHGAAPKTFVVRGVGLFAAAVQRRSADIAADVLTDAVKVAAYTKSFGGPNYMPEDQVRFIVNWEVEQYRKKISTGE